MGTHPALALLLTVGLLQYWLMPAIAWVLLKGQRDVPARLWFAGTACYAVTATLFVFRPMLPRELFDVLGIGFVFLSVMLFAESLRRELSERPAPWKWIAVVMLADLGLLFLISTYTGLEAMRAVQISIISLVELGCCVLLKRVIERRRSVALWFVMAGFITVLGTNILRLWGYFDQGAETGLLAFTATSNLAFVVNFLSVVLYSFGYWGFVIEKNRTNLLAESVERQRAQEGEVEARGREQFSRQLLAQRDELIEQLARMQRAAQVGALSASIAHEISQPLTSVRLAVEEAIAVRDAGGDPGRLRAQLERIARENERASRVIQTLRDLFRRQSSVLETRSLDEMVRGSCDLLGRRLAEQGVELQTALGAPVQVDIGAAELDHVLLNLLSNALDALARQASAAPRITIATVAHADHVVIRVRDNGPGVDASMRDRLFDLFSGSTPEGLGLGLWLSRYILERHGGDLQLEPLPAGEPGTEFAVRLRRVAGSLES